MTANDMGDSAVTRINGTFSDASDSDLYKICLANGASFSASTVGGTLPASLDTQLFLFDEQGYGVYANDDWAGARGSMLPAQHRFSPRTGGVYYLAVSQYNRDPQSSQGEIFPDTYSLATYPDDVVDASGFGASETLSWWDGRAAGAFGTYRITLTGTAVCAPPDNTKPTVNITSPVDGTHVAQGADVPVAFSCADEAGGSGLASCVGSTPNGGKLDTSALGPVTLTVTARDKAGNQRVATSTVTVEDRTKPTVNITSPVDGTHVAQGADVPVAFSCADEDGGSGLASCEGSTPNGGKLDTSSLGPVTLTVTARDNAGNEKVATSTVTVEDRTDPTVTLTTPADGAVYERGQHVAADYGCADEAGGSGLDTCAGDVANGADVDTSTLGDHSFTVTATDNAGNHASEVAQYTVVDDTAPQIVLNTPSQGAVYDIGQQVTASYSCSDEDGGSGLATCAGTVANGAAVDTSSLGQKSFTVNAKDNAGNPASKTVDYTVVDRVAPQITLSSPADGAVYGLGDRVLANYSCADQPGGSGVATCTGTVANGAPVDTSTFGSHTFEVHATDGAGNPAAKTVTYTVTYDFDGFFFPVRNPPGLTKWKAGVPVPVRFSLHGFRGARPEADGYPRSMRCGGGDMQQVARAAQGKKKSAFEYDRRSDKYVMLWKTDKKWAGSCRDFVLKLDDGSVHTARFQFAKKHDRDR